MRNATRMMICFVSLLCVFAALTPGIQAQGQATLVGRALLPAQTLADGPQSGAALGQAYSRS